MLSAGRQSPLIGVLVTCLLLSDVSPVFAQGPVQYVYDVNGRLVAVVDGAGNTSSYEYDATGNLLKIEHVTAASLPGAVGITLVSPNKGKIGTTVRIFWKGFSVTPSRNSVSFNGTSASVVAATTLSLTTTVPIGATTGPISVTTPLGSANSPTSFRVLGAISVSPTGANLTAGATQPFTATEVGNPTPSVTWMVNGRIGGYASVGTITVAGLYAAPATVPTPPSVTITATHADDPTLTASAVVSFLPPPAVFLGARAVSVTLLPPPVTVDRNLVAAVSVRLAESSALATAPPVTVALQPVITAMSPSQAAPGTAPSVTLTGSGFTGATSASVLLNNAMDGTITVSNLVVSGDGSATLTFSIAAGAATGPRVVRITTPGGTSTAVGTGGNVFTVQ